MMIVIAVAVVVLAVVGYVVYSKITGTPPATAYIEINAVPWGTVKTVTSSDGKVKLDVNKETPLRVPVPPGTYKVVIDGPSGQEQTVEVKVTNDNPGEVAPPAFEEIDVDQILNSN